MDLDFALVEPEVAAICERAAWALIDATGGIATDVTVSLRDYIGTYARIEVVDMFVGSIPICGARVDQLDPLVAPGWAAAQHLMVADHAHTDDMQSPALAAEGPMPTMISGQQVHGGMPMIHGMLANLANLPAMSVPAGVIADGLPVGLQLIGPRHREDLMLAAAARFESQQSVASPCPGYSRPMTTAFELAAARVASGTNTALDEARALVAQMMLDDKLGCLDGDLDAWPGLFAMMGGSYHERTFPAAVVERLGIPGIQFSDGPRGCVIGFKTAFPVSMARGATWDVDLERRIGEAIGAELRTVGANYYGGVCVNLLRHPGWGRAQETYGEEPYHVGEMGHALATGAQRHVMACVKHFAVNSMENARFRVDVRVDQRALHEVYLPHFRRIVAGGDEGGVASVMSAYNSLNGTFCGDNSELLTAILRDEWGFEGFVISDFIFGLRDAVQSVIAGLEIEMPFRQQRVGVLDDAVADGRLSLDVVDTAVTRIIATLLRFDAIIARPVDPAVAAGPAHRALAREAATRSIVLLRNEAILPLDGPSLRRVAVVGRLAAVKNLGDKGSSDVFVTDAVTPLDGLRAALPLAVVDHSDRDASIAVDADVAVVVVGFTFNDEGEYIDASGTAGLMGTLFPQMTDRDREQIAALVPRDATPRSPVEDITGLQSSSFAPGGDRRTLSLSSDDETLIRSTVAINPSTIVVIMGGSAPVIESWRHDVPAIVMLWYPGMEGGHALADVLLGQVSPSGHLPFSIPTDEAHLPPWDPDASTAIYDLWHGHWKLTRDGNAAAYPFGFGLSYTTFELGSLTAAADGSTATVAVTNVGSVDADTVIQVYAGVAGSRFERPAQRLVGFARVHVAAAARIDVDVDLDLGQLDVRVGTSWITEGGTYQIVAAQHVGDPHALTALLTRPESTRPAHPAHPAHPAR